MASGRAARTPRSVPRSPKTAVADAQKLERWFAEKGIRKAKVGGVDIDGVWRGKYISL